MDIYNLLLLIATVTFGIWIWWRSGFWIPKYIHIIAALTFIFGLLMLYITDSMDNPKLSVGIWIYLVILPFMVYVVFVLLGGAGDYVRNIDNQITYHASMDKRDVIEIFQEYIPRYLKMDMDELIAIGVDVEPIEIRPPNMRQYELYIRSTEDDDEEGQPYIAVGFWLEDRTRNRRYVPTAFTQIVFAEDGAILENPLEVL